MEKRRNRRHSAELKLRLVQAYLNGEGSFKSLSKAHDISHALLMLWVDKFRRGELTEEEDQGEKIREYEVKIAALERKVGQLTMEIDLLKKLQQTRPQQNATPFVISGPLDFPSSKDAES